MVIHRLLCLIPLLAINWSVSADTNAWRGVHLWVDNDRSAHDLISTLPALAKLGVNKVVVEVNYSYEFGHSPQLRQNTFIRQSTAHALAQAGRSNNVEIIPEFNCLGHQSFGRRIEPLLKVHPEFNETPHLSLTNPGVYCYSWCPLAPGLNEMVTSLMDEIADGFEAKSFHVGMDEVYLIGDSHCPRCRGKSPPELFAGQVKLLHQHLVAKRGLGMLMWADRIIGVKYQGTSQYDSAQNDLSQCIEDIPRDVIQCDWHYEWRRAYPSINYLTEKGFRVWPAGFEPIKAARALSDYARNLKNDRVLGYLATTWNRTAITNAHEWAPIKELIPEWQRPEGFTTACASCERSSRNTDIAGPPGARCHALAWRARSFDRLRRRCSN